MKKTSHHWRASQENKRTETQSATIISDAERQRFLADVNADFAALRNNPDAWQDEQAERAMWDCTLADGLADE
jgi:hypothetical protein